MVVLFELRSLEVGMGTLRLDWGLTLRAAGEVEARERTPALALDYGYGDHFWCGHSRFDGTAIYIIWNHAQAT